MFRSGGGAEPHALLRGRQLRPVHAVPFRDREGGGAAGRRRLGPVAARGSHRGDAGRVDLRARPGRRQPDPERAQAFPAGSPMTEASMSENISFELDGRTVEARPGETIWQVRSEEHTSELQSLMRIPVSVFFF